jgi:hypothetical protein
MFFNDCFGRSRKVACFERFRALSRGHHVTAQDAADSLAQRLQHYRMKIVHENQVVQIVEIS